MVSASFKGCVPGDGKPHTIVREEGGQEMDSWKAGGLGSSGSAVLETLCSFGLRGGFSAGKICALPGFLGLRPALPSPL